MCVECENAHAERIFFSLACGESVLQSALIFSEEVRCCKWKLSIGFIYPLFFFPSHLLLSLPLFFFSVQSVLPPPIFPPSAVFVPLYLHLFPSLPLFRSFIFFCLFCVSFPFCRCPTLTLSLSPLTLSLSPSLCRSVSPSLSCVLCFFVLCSRRPLDKQDSTFASQSTVHHHHHFALQKTPATCSRLPLPPLLAPPLHFESCRRQAAVG